MITYEVSEDTQKTSSVLEEATATLRAETSIRGQEREEAAQNVTKSASEQSLEGSCSRRASPFKNMTKRWS